MASVHTVQRETKATGSARRYMDLSRNPHLMLGVLNDRLSTSRRLSGTGLTVDIVESVG